MNQIGLVHIDVASLADAFKVLDSNRVQHGVMRMGLIAERPQNSKLQISPLFSTPWVRGIHLEYTFL